MSKSRSPFNVLFGLICFGIIYGSLFPFQFSLDLPDGTIANFLSSWRSAPSRGDILGNIALFVPYGLVAYLLSIQPGKIQNVIGFPFRVWLLVAVGSQVAQLFIPSRDPSIFDLYGNGLGAILGWFLGRFLPRGLAPLIAVNDLRLTPGLLALCWLASELIPFVPTIDFQAYKNAVKPLLLVPQWSWNECLLQATSWLVFIYLLDQRLGLNLRLGRLLTGALSILLLKVVIVQNRVSLTDVVAMVSALLFWASAARHRARPAFLGWFLLASFFLNAVFPWAIRADAAVFSWIPFSGFLQGSMLVNATAVCLKLFIFGSVIFLTQHEKSDWKRKALPIALLLLGLEIVQIWIASGSPEVTDPLLFLALAWLYSSVGSFSPVSEASPSRFPGTGGGGIAKNSSDLTPELDRATELLRQYLPASHIPRPSPFALQLALEGSDRKWVATAVGVYCALAVLSMDLVLGSAAIPYNVRELFGGRGDVFDYLFFSLSLLSIGWGSAWLGRVFATTRKPAIDVQIALLKLMLVVYLFLWLSVTEESIKDIVGSNVFDHRLEEGAVFGDFGVAVVHFFGRDTVRVITDIFEPIVRFAALIGPLLVFSGLSLAIMQRVTGTFLRTKNSNRVFGITCLWLLPGLYVSKVITFDWWATDNLYELIARDGAWGIGGGGYLYFLLLLLAALSTLVTWAFFKKTGMRAAILIILMASLPVGWLLLNQGLEQDVFKNHRYFSAVKFLLAPDKISVIGQSELFFRWSFIQMVFAAGMAFGAILYLRWAGQGATGKSPDSDEVVPLKFSVYSNQCEFLSRLAMHTGLPVGSLVHSVIAYFGDEIANSPDSRSVVQDYIYRDRATSVSSFSPEKIELELTPETIDILASVDPDNVHSESRIFRKLLEIFMEASQEPAP